MTLITQQEIIEFVEANIPNFHQNRLKKLQSLKFSDVLKRKNPYLFKAKNIETSNDLVRGILEMRLGSLFPLNLVPIGATAVKLRKCEITSIKQKEF
jgi:hypothetical protein